jgi:hypothetical protein
VRTALRGRLVRLLVGCSSRLASYSASLSAYALRLSNRNRWDALNTVALSAAESGGDPLATVFKALEGNREQRHGVTIADFPTRPEDGWRFMTLPDGAVADFPTLFGQPARSVYSPSQYDEGIARLVEKYGVQIIVIPDSDGKAHSVCAPEARC